MPEENILKRNATFLAFHKLKINKDRLCNNVNSLALSDHNSKLSFLQSQMTTSTVQDESTSAVQHQSLPANRSLEPTHPSSIRRPRETHNPAKILGSIQEEVNIGRFWL